MYLSKYIIEKLDAKDIKFISLARAIRQPEFLEMLQGLQIDEGIAVKFDDRNKYTTIFVTSKRYAKLLNIEVKLVKRETDVVVIRKK